ncbi:glycine betaine/choline ABC-type transport system substrate-binding protein [Chryseomicrobium aureum]|uniref:glycine betaine ABC transporter substrate-binding protein n=1 Tax=Chryseomicrobium aureum TaxID=1441723 RepID=UPI00195B8A0E|nr:glycine betaine ABC transporter substrate-binding protein [Chryseomicrobium aureum]MBM7705899.1 glycine betaine/choline ABC-type transport system substrate-binding protein [Chryseomicrobium aureum]
MKTWKKGMVAVTSTAALVLAGCGGDSSGGDGDNEIVVGGKPWTEQFILPQIIGQYLEANSDYDIKYQEGLGEVSILTPAIDNGDIDIYVEYTGTGLKDVLGLDSEVGESAEDVFNRVKEGYEEEFNVTWLEPLGFENTYTLAYTEDSGISAMTYSDLAELSKSQDLVFGAPHSFYERQGDGYDDLTSTYGFEFSGTESLDANIMYEALRNGDVDVIPAFTTDGRIERFNLQMTEDDMGFFPKYDAAPLVRMETLEQFPDLEELMNALAGSISEEEMIAMNARVDIDGDRAEDVARDFLIEKGLIEE